MTLKDLPTLTITALGNEVVEVVWSDPKWIGDGYIACIISDSDQFVWGRLSKIESRKSGCEFTPNNPAELAKLEEGRTYPQLDSYWGERAELVFDRSLVWKDQEYVAPDGVWIERSRTMRPFSGEVPDGGVLVKGGWDHEHCEICCDSISQQTNPIGVFAEPYHWICKECYRRFIIPRSLDFIVDTPAKP